MIKYSKQNYINQCSLLLNDETYQVDLYNQFQNLNSSSLPFFINIKDKRISQLKLEENHEESFLIGTFSKQSKEKITIENFSDKILFRIKKYFQKYLNFVNKIFTNADSNDILSMLVNKPGYYYYYPNTLLSQVLSNKTFFDHDVNTLTFLNKNKTINLFKVLLLLNDESRTKSIINYLRKGSRDDILTLFDFLEQQKIKIDYDLCISFLKDKNYGKEDIKNLLFNYLSFLYSDKHLSDYKMDLYINRLNIVTKKEKLLEMMGLQQSFSTLDCETQCLKHQKNKFNKNIQHDLPYQYRYSFFSKEKNKIKNIYILEIENVTIKKLIDVVDTLDYENCYISKKYVDSYIFSHKNDYAIMNDSEYYNTFLDYFPVKNAHVVYLNKNLLQKHIPNFMSGFDYTIF